MPEGIGRPTEQTSGYGRYEFTIPFLAFVKATRGTKPRLHHGHGDGVWLDYSELGYTCLTTTMEILSTHLDFFTVPSPPFHVMTNTTSTWPANTTSAHGATYTQQQASPLVRHAPAPHDVRRRKRAGRRSNGSEPSRCYYETTRKACLAKIRGAVGLGSSVPLDPVDLLL
ncbi:hypothetical protein OPT61_g5197 [Boeremia exigua]|uniref:Uncharacterized protein n=1 Tax=Boeremia exigua TaxID=749465 RepID=A0ACC2IBA2_9PLEO|nr:hypothetical protein OPT61_g5197 [Boeremia exigua]